MADPLPVPRMVGDVIVQGALPSHLTTTALDAAYKGAGGGSVPFTVFTGGDPTGTNDSYSALQSALNSALAMNLEFVIPAGNFKCSAALTASASTVRIRGAGVGKTILRFTTSAVNLLTVGNGNGAQVQPTGWLRDLAVTGPTPRPTSGKGAVVINGLNQFSVENVQVDNQDIGFDLINNCYGTQFINLRGGFGGSVNVGINLRSGPQSGSDITFINPWVAGRVAAVHISGEGGGYHFFGGQLSGGQGATTANDNAGAVIVGRDYLTGATGEATADFTDTSFEGTNYAWSVRTFDQVRVNLRGVAFSPQESTQPAIGALKMTSAKNSVVNISGHIIAGHWSAAKLLSVEGAYDDLYLIEDGGYVAANRPRIAGVETYAPSLLEQSQPLPGKWSSRRGSQILSGAGALGVVRGMTQSQYDALGYKDPAVLYVITGS